jgi:hypothetical protein
VRQSLHHQGGDAAPHSKNRARTQGDRPFFPYSVADISRPASQLDESCPADRKRAERAHDPVTARHLLRAPLLPLGNNAPIPPAGHCLRFA